MKKRRTLIIAVLLVTALVLGVGYATLSRELVISSTANLEPDQTDFDIIFTDAKVESAIAEAATASVTGNSSTANYTITGLSKQNEKVKLIFEITNNTADVHAQLTRVTHIPGTLTVGSSAANIEDYFSKETEIVDGANTVYNGTDTFVLSPGEKATVTVVVTLKQTVTSAMVLNGASIKLDFANYIPTP